MAQNFGHYLRQLQERTSPSVRAFAEQLGVNPTHISRAMGTNSRPFDIRGLFKLARVTGEHPSAVLRAAGKGDIADLIEEFYGTARPMPPPLKISPTMKAAMKLWEQVEAAKNPEADDMLDICTQLLRKALRLANQQRHRLRVTDGQPGNRRLTRARQQA